LLLARRLVRRLKPPRLRKYPQYATNYSSKRLFHDVDQDPRDQRVDESNVLQNNLKKLKRVFGLFLKSCAFLAGCFFTLLSLGLGDALDQILHRNC